MYRCITKLKGLIIDIDSFSNQLSDWKNIAIKFKCLFITSNIDKVSCFEQQGLENVYKIEPYEKIFIPNAKTHIECLEKLQLNATEVAYVSQNLSFLNNAGSFLGGTIWMTPNITYEQASTSPDLICRTFENLEKYITSDVKGFYGELSIDPINHGSGIIPITRLEMDNDIVPLYYLGRYFGYSHYMSQLHPYSKAMGSNKKAYKSYYRKFDNSFSHLYIVACNQMMAVKSTIDGVCCVPTRPNKGNRFDDICRDISRECEIENLEKNFICTTNYPTQKGLTAEERARNVIGCFKYNGNLHGRNIVLIDDVITTGSTVKECVKTLKNAGADNVYVVVLGITQLGGSYWSSETAQISCPNCDEKMVLAINKNGQFYYWCPECNKNIGFRKGKDRLCEQVNLSILQNIEIHKKEQSEI